MALGDDIARDTVSDLNQYVHSWLDDFERRLRSILDDYEISIEARKKEPR